MTFSRVLCLPESSQCLPESYHCLVSLTCLDDIYPTLIHDIISTLVSGTVPTLGIVPTLANDIVLTKVIYGLSPVQATWIVPGRNITDCT